MEKDRHGELGDASFNTVLLCTANTPHGPEQPITHRLSPRNCSRRERGKEEGSPEYNPLILLCWLKG